MTIEIRFDDCTDWGQVDADDDDRAAYEQALADAIHDAYPSADVTVQCIQIHRPRAVATLRDAEGRILSDNATEECMGVIEKHVLEIARGVWEVRW